MKKLIFLSALSFLLLASCTPSKKMTTETTTATTSNTSYGYAVKDPIKVEGLADTGPNSEHAYLNKLAGPNGERVKYYREKSCCPFKTKNALFNDTGLLDVYIVSWKGGESVKLYLNMYDPADEELKIPEGFTLRGSKKIKKM